jgi:hypothetical protein
MTLNNYIPIKVVIAVLAACAVAVPVSMAVGDALHGPNASPFLASHPNAAAFLASHPSVASAVSAAQQGLSYPTVRGYGGDPAKATAIGRMSDGATVSVTSSDTGRCVLFRGDGAFGPEGEFCTTAVKSAEGEAPIVTDDCSTAHGAMRIALSLPAGSTRATIINSNGSSAPMTVADSVAWLEGQTPSASDAYPVTIEAYNESGGPTATIKFPVGPGQFCPGA